MEITAALKEKDKADELTSDEGIKVVVHIPDNVPETIRQQKINRIYDIRLKKKRNDVEKNFQKKDLHLAVGRAIIGM